MNEDQLQQYIAAFRSGQAIRLSTSMDFGTLTAELAARNAHYDWDFENGVYTVYRAEKPEFVVNEAEQAEYTRQANVQQALNDLVYLQAFKQLENL